MSLPSDSCKQHNVRKKGGILNNIFDFVLSTNGKVKITNRVSLSTKACIYRNLSQLQIADSIFACKSKDG